MRASSRALPPLLYALAPFATFAVVAVSSAALTIAHAQTSTPASRTSDSFVAGYVTAVLERELDVRPLAVEVVDGAVRVVLPPGAAAQDERVRTLLSDVTDVRSVIVERAPVDAAPTAGEPGPAIVPAPAPGGAPAPGAAAVAETTERGVEFLPRGHIFEPLLADPRWPRFSAAYERYLDDDVLEDAAAVALGGEFPILRWDGPAGGRMQLGLHGGIFAIFDLGADSKDLINADYRIGLPVTYERGRMSAMARVFHQSSHLGDEFLLRQLVERVNLSYEAVDVLASVRPWRPLRLYGGGGVLFHQEPSDLDPWWVQTGVEVSSSRTYLRFLRPVAALDLQFHDESDFATDLSLRTGVLLESPRLSTQRMALLLEYYDGRNPNGQFFDARSEYAGVGIQGHF